MRREAIKFRCNDLWDDGIVLIPPDSAAFTPLFADIRRHIEAPPPGWRPRLPNEPDTIEADPAGAILWNQSGKPICAWTLIWKSHWRDEFDNEHTTSSNYILGVGHSPSLLLPFGLPEDRRAFETCWHTILPDSKRHVTEGNVLGSNADVRPPADGEKWKGGIMGWQGTGRGPVKYLHGVTLILDAAFFATGECVGPDTHQLWEHVVTDAEIHREIAEKARAAAGFDAARILAEIEEITGPGNPPPPPPPHPGGRGTPNQFAENARWHLAHRIAHMRTRLGDERTVSELKGWAYDAAGLIRRFRNHCRSISLPIDV